MTSASCLAIKPKTFQQAVLSWYDRHGRKNLPWQQAISSYRVWLSEVMLQQTQVKTVIPYFERFTHHFPTVEALAKAELDEVTHLWAGLGYYSRARNLHKTAQIINEQYHGNFPETVEELEALPGIGRSTAGAILALSQNRFAPILDGNVKRVLTRVFCVAGWPESSRTKKQLWQLATELTSKERPKEYTQAMMDIGALLCTRTKPNCSECPLVKHCQAHKESNWHQYPEKKPKKRLPTKQTTMLLLTNSKSELLVEKRPPHGIWSDLWCLPEFETIENLTKHIKDRYGLAAQKLHDLPEIKHTFSHFHLMIKPILIECEATSSQVIMETLPSLWYNPNQHQLGFPKPVQQLIADYLQGALVCHE